MSHSSNIYQISSPFTVYIYVRSNRPVEGAPSIHVNQMLMRFITDAFYVRGALCKHTYMYTGEVVIFVMHSFLTSSFV